MQMRTIKNNQGQVTSYELSCTKSEALALEQQYLERRLTGAFSPASGIGISHFDDEMACVSIFMPTGKSQIA